MLDRNDLFTKNTKKVRKIDIKPFVETFKIQLEKLDFESINAFEYKMDILRALDNNDYVKVSNILDDLEIISKNTEEFTYIKNLSVKAEQLVRLSK